MLGHGVLPLIAPKHIKFTLLIILCHQEMTENLMCARVGEIFTISRDILSNNKHLRDTFDIVNKDQEFSPSIED